jgi:hypothetical protein
MADEAAKPPMSTVDQARQKIESLRQMKAGFEREKQAHLDRLNKEWADIQATLNAKIIAAEREILKTEGVVEFLTSLQKPPATP